MDIEKWNIPVIIRYKEINVNQSINIDIKHGEARYACANCEYAATQAGSILEDIEKENIILNFIFMQ